MTGPIVIVALTPGGAALARRVGRQVPGSEVHLPEEFRESDGCLYFSDPLSSVLPELFAQSRGLVCIMATGIVVRILSPHLGSKERDPAVVVMDEKGQFAISLLSGHLGGANDLARDLARITGGEAVITTATDVNNVPAWDEVARDEGLGIEPIANLARLNGLLLRKEKIVLLDRSHGRVAAHYANLPAVLQVTTFAEAIKAGGAGKVFVTNRFIPGLENQEVLLVLRPRNLVVGIGCNRGTPAAEIEEAVKAELFGAFLALRSIACVATIDLKSDEEGITEFARRHDLPIEYHSAGALAAMAAPSAPSRHVLRAVGSPGVCEPAALLSAGSGARLLVHKKKHGNVTVAVAERP